MKQLTLQELQDNIAQRWGNEIEYEILEFGSARQPITIKCLKCGNTYTLQYRNNLFNKTRKNFCTFCGNTHRPSEFGRGRPLPLSEAQRRLDKEFHGEYVIIPESYKSWTEPCLIKHTICGKIFSKQPRYLFHNSHCPCITINSKGENNIIKILDKYNVKYETQKRLQGIMKAPYDFYLPDFNLLIEFQGRQHFEPVKAFGGKKQFEVQKEIDLRKKKIALEQNYDILYISYKEMSSIEEILVQRLSLTGVDSSESKSQSSQSGN